MTRREESQRVALRRMLLSRGRRSESGQSLVVAIIVLFLLLFLGGLFIALIANNLRNTARGTKVSAANKFGEAGIRYLDQQLMTSPEGADWRPPASNSANTKDPDHFWLKPYEPATGEGGFTRITFGGPTPTQGNLGGRALIRITYRPSRPGEVSTNKLNKYLKLESIGRVGVIDDNDPTTFNNTEGKGLRRELIAYKAIGLTDYIWWVTNKDKKPNVSTLGSMNLVQDRPRTLTGTPDADNVTDIPGDPNTAGDSPYGGSSTDTDAALEVINRPIPTIFQGPIRVNSDLAFYGLNYLVLDSNRNDAVEVVGQIKLTNVSSTVATAGLTGTDPTKVFVVEQPNVNNTNNIVRFVGLDGTAPTAGNVLPSTSPEFTTLNGLVRDNPRGNETQGLENSMLAAEAGNANLRAVPYLAPPVLDAPIGDRGLTRYRALTRNAPPMAPNQVTPNAITLSDDAAGAYGWGQNLYIPNGSDIERISENLSNVVSLRSQWLNPESESAGGNYWNAQKTVYTPPAVTIELSPRFIKMVRNAQGATGNRNYLRYANGGNINQSTVIRYTYDGTGVAAMQAAPTAGIDDPVAGSADIVKLAGYPAVKNADGITGTDDDNIYTGELVIYAEGNVRIKGVAGGYDPETGETFVRNLTVVSNGTIYVDGNVLRDNIPNTLTAAPILNAKGKSSIALLAKNYVAVNTTQFLSPTVSTAVDGETQSGPLAVKLDTNQSQQFLSFAQGPTLQYDTNGLPILDVAQYNVVPAYANAGDVNVMFRHGRIGNPSTFTAMNLFVNKSAAGAQIVDNAYNFGAGTTLVLGEDGSETFVDDYFQLDPNQLFLPTSTQAYPYAGTPPSLGQTNQLIVNYDASVSLPDLPPPGVEGNVTRSNVPLLETRIGIVPQDIRVEALMYAQEGSFFIIPGPWFNPIPDDTYERYIEDKPVATRLRPGESGSDIADPAPRVDPRFPFYKEPLDIRMTFVGAITQNLAAETGDQGAWLEKWGWVPRYQGSTGLPTANGLPGYSGFFPLNHNAQATKHGPRFGAPPVPDYYGPTGNGIQYIYDPRATAPYTGTGAASIAIRPDPNSVNHPIYGRGGTTPNKALWDPLPLTPRLPVAPGLLYYGDNPIR